MGNFMNTYLAGRCNGKILLHFTFLVRTPGYNRLLTECHRLKQSVDKLNDRRPVLTKTRTLRAACSFLYRY